MSQTNDLEKPYIAGLWKFQIAVPVETLIALAKKWADEDQCYRQIFIRKVSNEENAICFIYEPEAKTSWEAYLRTKSGELRNEFGQHLTGWDVASPIFLVK